MRTASASRFRLISWVPDGLRHPVQVKDQHRATLAACIENLWTRIGGFHTCLDGSNKGRRTALYGSPVCQQITGLGQREREDSGAHGP